nr:PREDICTED: L-galactose dehydrogenase-like isoform X1 [Bemisia tabaci]
MSVETFTQEFHDESSVRKMSYRTLGRTNLQVSKLSLGGGPFGGLYEASAETEGTEIILSALKLGINYLDTAPHYGLGRSEKFFGKVLKEVPRKAFYISTKVGHYDNYFDFSAKSVVASLEKSLSLLGLSCVDIVYIHDIEFAPSLDYIISETIPALLKMKEKNKLRFIGASAYPVSILKNLCEISDQIDVVLSYSRDTLFDSTLEDYLPFFKSKNIGVVNASCTGMGLLSTVGPQTWHPATDHLKEICRKAVAETLADNVELGKLAVYFCLQKSYISSCLVGMGSTKILKLNLDAAFNNISDEEKQVLNRIKQRYFDGENYHWEEPDLNVYKKQIETCHKYKYKYESFMNL